MRAASKNKRSLLISRLSTTILISGGVKTFGEILRFALLRKRRMGVADTTCSDPDRPGCNTRTAEHSSLLSEQEQQTVTVWTYGESTFLKKRCERLMEYSTQHIERSGISPESRDKSSNRSLPPRSTSEPAWGSGLQSTLSKSMAPRLAFAVSPKTGPSFQVGPMKAPHVEPERFVRLPSVLSYGD